jgi:hypothetical protein
MRKYHSHTLLYLHETIALGTGSSAGSTPETKVGYAIAELGFQMSTLASESQALRRGAAAGLDEARGDR